MLLASYGQFEATLGPDNWALMKSNLSNDDALLKLLTHSQSYVCCDGDRVIGIAFLIPSGNPTPIFEAGWCYLRLVGVHPAYEGRGIARQLTQMCISHAILSGEKTIALHTSEFMDAARHIYESLGFKVLKEIGSPYGKKYWVYTMGIGH